MRRAPGVRTLVAAVAAFAALVLATPAEGITRAQANEIARTSLKPEREPGAVILFGLPKPVGAAQIVTELATPGLIKTAGKAAWLFWEDLAPGAMFQHRSVVMLVDDATGTVLLRKRLSYYPLIDGRAPPYFASGEVYNAPAYHVFASPPAAARAAEPVTRPAPSPFRISGFPPDLFKNDCLLLVVLTPEKNNGVEKNTGNADLQGWTALSTSLKIPAFVATSAGPLDAAGLPGGVNAPSFNGQVGNKGLAANIRVLVEREGCKDIAIVIDGHGYGAPSKPGIVTATATPTKSQLKKNPTLKPRQKTITPGGLVAIAQTYVGKAEFKLIFDACYAERMIDPVIAQPNVAIALASSNSAEVSYFNSNAYFSYLNPDIKPATPNPGRSEFTHGLIEGVRQAVAGDQPITGLADLFKQGFAREKANDRPAQAGLTHPVEKDRLPAVPGFEIVEMSHYHPPGSTTSRICGTAKGPPGGLVIIRLTFLDTGEVRNSLPANIDPDGLIAFGATIGTPGLYRLEVIFEGVTATFQDYLVPDPPAQGPHTC